MNCAEVHPLIHEYLDGDLAAECWPEFKTHLHTCPECARWLRQLEQTEALISAAPEQAAPPELALHVVQQIPMEERKSRQPNHRRWFRRHPALTVAVCFILVMFGSFMAQWKGDHELVVKGKDLSQIEIQGNKVIVPATHTVAGSLMVKNGTIQVDGKVKGNLVVVDGSVEMASTAEISGEVTKVNQAIGWLWYQCKHWFNAGSAKNPSPS